MLRFFTYYFQIILLGLLLSSCGPNETKEESVANSTPSAPSNNPSTSTDTATATSKVSYAFVSENINLGSATKNTNTVTQTATLKNNGSKTISCSSLSYYNGSAYYGEFTIVEDNCYSRSLAAGQQCTYRIRGTPSTTGERVYQYRLNCYDDTYSSSSQYAFLTVTMTGL